MLPWALPALIQNRTNIFKSLDFQSHSFCSISKLWNMFSGRKEARRLLVEKHASKQPEVLDHLKTSKHGDSQSFFGDFEGDGNPHPTLKIIENIMISKVFWIGGGDGGPTQRFQIIEDLLIPIVFLAG